MIYWRTFWHGDRLFSPLKAGVLDRGADHNSRMGNDSAPIVPTPSCGEEKSNDSVELMGIEPTASRVRF